jgi:hypothetical protein
VAESDKHTSLLPHEINYDHKKFCSTGLPSFVERILNELRLGSNFVPFFDEFFYFFSLF